MTDEEFGRRFGPLFEHSPWVVERAAANRPFADLHAGLMQVVYDATDAERLALIRAHPELAGKAAIDRTLTAESTSEQASAGLDRLTEAEFARFHELNAAYGERFGFPFIICVRLTDKAGILAAMQARLANDRETELAAAIQEIGKIVRLRLADLNLKGIDGHRPSRLAEPRDPLAACDCRHRLDRRFLLFRLARQPPYAAQDR